jgi:hypothetical protein
MADDTGGLIGAGVGGNQ